MMYKNTKERTTRQSTTLIQSEVALSQPNKLIFTRILLQYKWLKPQLQALYLHQFTQLFKQYRIHNIKDVYINSLQSVQPKAPLLRKCYRMQETIKQIKKLIVRRTKDTSRPQIKSPLFQFIKEKYRKILRQKYIHHFKEKIDPKIVHQKQSNHSNTKIRTCKSPQPTLKINKQSKQKLNNTKVVDYNEQDYGLKRFHIKNKLSLHNIKEGSSDKKITVKVNDYRPNVYGVKSKHKKTNSSHTPKKSVASSRKLSEKQLLTVRSQKVSSENKLTKTKKKA